MKHFVFVCVLIYLYCLFIYLYCLFIYLCCLFIYLCCLFIYLLKWERDNKGMKYKDTPDAAVRESSENDSSQKDWRHAEIKPLYDVTSTVNSTCECTACVSSVAARYTQVRLVSQQWCLN